MANITVIFTQPPYGAQAVSDGLEFALASTNYGHECAVLFSGLGVYQLLANQAPTQQKNHAKQLKVMPLYDIESVFVCATSLSDLGLTVDDLAVEAIPVSSQEIRKLLADCDHTVTF